MILRFQKQTYEVLESKRNTITNDSSRQTLYRKENEKGYQDSDDDPIYDTFDANKGYTIPDNVADMTRYYSKANPKDFKISYTHKTKILAQA